MKISRAIIPMDGLFAGVDWQQQHLSLSEGIARSETIYTSAGLDEQGYEFQNFTAPRMDQLRAKLDPAAIATLDSLSSTQQVKFLSFYHGFNTMPVVIVRNFNSFATKHLAAETKDASNRKHFDPLMRMLDERKVFSQIGRVVIFLSPIGYEARPHRDWEWVDNSEEFVWLNPSLAKRFFVMDGSVPTYIEGHAAWFDTTAIHGGDRAPRATYSVRIDGVFSDTTRDFLNKTVVTP